MPQSSVATSSIRTNVVAGSLSRTSTSRSVIPLISEAFCAGVAPSRVIAMFTYGMSASVRPGRVEIEVEHLGDDLPSALDFHQRQQVGEPFRTNRAAHPGQRGHRPDKVDRLDHV